MDSPLSVCFSKYPTDKFQFKKKYPNLSIESPDSIFIIDSELGSKEDCVFMTFLLALNNNYMFILASDLVG